MGKIISHNNKLQSFNNKIILLESIDSDVLSFLTITSISDATISNALNIFVKELKANGLWTKYAAIYPFVGGTATTHLYNLKDTSLYQVTFNGGITHNSNGITLNGTTGYVDTNLPNNILGQNSISLAIYSKTGGNTGFDISGDATPRTQLNIQYTAGQTFYDLNNTVANSSASPGLGVTATGLYQSTRTASNVIKLFRRGVLTLTDTDTTSLPDATTFNIGRFTSGGFFSNRNYAYASFSSSMTDAECTIHDTLVQQLQTSLGRNAY